MEEDKKYFSVEKHTADSFFFNLLKNLLDLGRRQYQTLYIGLINEIRVNEVVAWIWMGFIVHLIVLGESKPMRKNKLFLFFKNNF